MSKNKNLESFRTTATDDQWLKLVADHENLTADDFQKNYGFSWNGIRPDAVERGYYTPSRRSSVKDLGDAPSAPKVPTFSVGAEFAAGPLTKGSVQLCDSISARLRCVEESFPQYTKRGVLNALLDAGLRFYGF